MSFSIHFVNFLKNNVSRYYDKLFHSKRFPKYKSDELEEENGTIRNFEGVCSVYLMVDTTNNFHKIGISNKPQFRERTLQSEKPTIEKLILREFPSRLIASSIESALHNAYAEKRIRGEWFELTAKDILEIMETLK